MSAAMNGYRLCIGPLAAVGNRDIRLSLPKSKFVNKRPQWHNCKVCGRACSQDSNPAALSSRVGDVTFCGSYHRRVTGFFLSVSTKGNP